MRLSRAALAILALGGARAEESVGCDAASGACDGDSPSMLQVAKQRRSEPYCIGGTGICECSAPDMCFQDGHVGCQSNSKEYDPQFMLKNCSDAGRCECKPLPATDIRPRTPSCLQYQIDWCWATAISEVAAFYNKSYRVSELSDPRQRDCHCVECYVVGLVNSASCCPPSPTRDVCRTMTGTDDDIKSGIKRTVGVDFTEPAGYGGILSQHDLDRVVAKKQPMVLWIDWCPDIGQSHVLTMAGSDGNGTYYVHDPLNHELANVTPPFYYQQLSYDQIVHYVQPWQGGGKGVWTLTFFVDDPDLRDIQGPRPSEC